MAWYDIHLVATPVKLPYRLRAQLTCRFLDLKVAPKVARADIWACESPLFYYRVSSVPIPGHVKRLQQSSTWKGEY